MIWQINRINQYNPCISHVWTNPFKEDMLSKHRWKAHPESLFASGAGSNFPYATEIVKKLNEEGKDCFDLKVEMAQASNISYHVTICYVIVYILIYIYVCL